MNKNQNGFTLIEIAIVLFIMGVMAAAAASSSAILARDSKAQAIADQMKTLSGAVNTLIASNFDPIVAGSPVAGFANPLAPTVPELVAKGYLANNFRNKNLAGTGFLVKVSKVPAGCVAPACDLAALTYPDAGFVKNGTPDLMLTAAVSAKLGNDGGTSLDATPATISGPDGAWTAANPLGAVQGVVALQTGFGAQGLSQFVRMGDSRAVTLNGGLTNNGALSVTGATTTAGWTNNGALTNNGNASIAGTATAGVISSATGNITTINATNATLTNGVLTVADPSGYGTQIYGTGGNASIYSYKPGWSSYTQVVNGTPWGPGWNGVYTSQGTYMNGANGIVNAGLVNTTNAQINGVATTGGSCAGSPNGLVAHDGTGLLLSCQSGVWAKAQGGGGGVIHKAQLGAAFANLNADIPVVLQICGGGGSFCSWLSVSTYSLHAVTDANGTLSFTSCIRTSGGYNFPVGGNNAPYCQMGFAGFGYTTTGISASGQIGASYTSYRFVGSTGIFPWN